MGIGLQGILAGLERFDLECFDGLEVFGIRGDDSEFVLDGGGGDERIGELQVMREKVFFDEPGGALRDRRGNGQDGYLPERQVRLQVFQFARIAHALHEFHVGHH